MTKYRVSYFKVRVTKRCLRSLSKTSRSQGRGGGENLRMTLAFCGTDFEDNRMEYPEMVKVSSRRVFIMLATARATYCIWC
jgi:hypothetical protein